MEYGLGWVEKGFLGLSLVGLPKFSPELFRRTGTARTELISSVLSSSGSDGSVGGSVLGSQNLLKSRTGWNRFEPRTEPLILPSKIKKKKKKMRSMTPK